MKSGHPTALRPTHPFKGNTSALHFLTARHHAAGKETMVVGEAEAAAAPAFTSALATSRNPNDICFADVCALFEKIRGVNKTGFKAGRLLRGVRRGVRCGVRCDARLRR